MVSQYLTIYAFVFLVLKFRKRWNYRKVGSSSSSDNTQLRLNGTWIIETPLSVSLNCIKLKTAQQFTASLKMFIDFLNFRFIVKSISSICHCVGYFTMTTQTLILLRYPLRVKLGKTVESPGGRKNDEKIQRHDNSIT